MNSILRPLHVIIVLIVGNAYLWNVPVGLNSSIVRVIGIISYLTVIGIFSVWCDVSNEILRSLLWILFRNKMLIFISPLSDTNPLIYNQLHFEICKGKTRFIREGYFAFKWWVNDRIEEEYKLHRYMHAVK